MKKTHYIYRITHLPTGRFYIGKRSCKGAWQDDRYMGSGTYLRRLLKKYPRDQFKKEVLCLCRDELQAYKAEKAAIGTQWKTDPLCINLTDGGGGVVGYNKLPETRREMSEKRKQLFRDNPDLRAVVSARLVKYRAENPDAGKVHAEFMKKRFEDPDNRKEISEGLKKYFEDPAARQANSAAQLKHHTENPYTRVAISNSLKKYFEDPAARAANAKAQIRPTVKMRRDGVECSVPKEELLAALIAGAEFINKMTTIHHPTEGVCLPAGSNTAKHLLLLGVGWEFGNRTTLVQISMKRVDKATGRVLPA